MTEVAQVGASEEPHRGFLLLTPLMTGDRRVPAWKSRDTVLLPPLRANAFADTPIDPASGAPAAGTSTIFADPGLTEALEAAVAALDAQTAGAGADAPAAGAEPGSEGRDDPLFPVPAEIEPDSGNEPFVFVADEALPPAPARPGPVRSEAPASPAPSVERLRVEDLAARLEEIAQALREHGPAHPLLSQARDPLSALIAGYLVGYLEKSGGLAPADTTVSC